jgi:hypothetical protein
MPSFLFLAASDYPIRYLQCPEEFPINEYEEWVPLDKEPRTEDVGIDTCIRVITDTDVYWEAYLKHTGIKTATSHLDIAQLTKLQQIWRPK